MTDTITIDKKLYDSLIDCRNKLTALECGGVDNWEGYYEATRDYYKEKFPEDYEDDED